MMLQVLAAARFRLDSIDVGFFLCVMAFAGLLVAGLFVFRRYRARAGQPDPRRRSARGTNFVVDAKRDETYMPPPHLAEQTAGERTEGEPKPADRAPSASPPPQLRQPRQLLSCPRCNQAVLGDQKLAEGRVVCPACGCKFYLPRGTLEEK